MSECLSSKQIINKNYISGVLFFFTFFQHHFFELYYYIKKIKKNVQNYSKFRSVQTL